MLLTAGSVYAAYESQLPDGSSPTMRDAVRAQRNIIGKRVCFIKNLTFKLEKTVVEVFEDYVICAATCPKQVRASAAHILFCCVCASAVRKLALKRQCPPLRLPLQLPADKIRSVLAAPLGPNVPPGSSKQFINLVKAIGEAGSNHVSP